MGLLLDIGKIPRERITERATLDGDLRMESVAFIEIQVATEDRFDIEIDLIEVVGLNEFGAIIDYVHALARVAAASQRAVND